MTSRHFSPLDRLLIGADAALGTVFGRPQASERTYPAREVDDNTLTEAERQTAEALMRVNHVGEVCAQALYQAQALTARTDEARDTMKRAAIEENDHLDWCEKRLNELGGRKSLLNPLWYAGSFVIGATAGLVGDKWNLGFVAETERQVVRHLEGHLDRLPAQDARSRAIVEQMAVDEHAHATAALQAGAVELPEAVKQVMQLASRVMTRTAHYL